VTYPPVGRISHSAALAAAVGSLGGRQDGLVTRNQLRRLGLSEDRIDSWVRAGRLRRVSRGVYAVGPAELDARARIHAGVLACGPEAVVSHRSAAFLLGIGERSPVVVDLISPGQRGRRVDGIRVHDVPYPASTERGHVRGIPCTSPARTIVDLAGTYGDGALRETVEWAATERKLDLAAIDTILATGPRRRGAPCLRGVLDDWRPVAETAKYATVRSLFEAKLMPLVVAAGLPVPRFNAPVSTAERILEVDLFWEHERFVVEADSRRHHAIEVAFERDRKRDRELLAVRYGVLRVTWREVEDEADAVFAVVHDELQRRMTSATR
jgi:very-short-patch-repair endonuclease